jgi:GNAT superfamily N-acetyltransferase
MEIHNLSTHREVIPVIAKWFYQEWPYLYPNRTLSDIEQAIEGKKIKNKILTTLVAFEGEILLGTVSLKIHDMNIRLDLTPWLAGLYVEEHWRRQGIGTALVNAIEQKAKAISIRRLYLYTLKSEGFYIRLGWRVKERTEYHGFQVPIMEKEII